MAFAFAGSHRTGKTTLAKKVAEDLGYAFHDASVSKIMREAGINAVGDIPLQARIEAQEFLLKRFIKDLSLAPRPLITDRTPLDMIGYAFGEITMHNTDAALGSRIDEYASDCITATMNLFDTIIIVRPLPHYVQDPKSPAFNPGYQTMVQMLIEGAAVSIQNRIYIETLHTSDFEERRMYSGQYLKSRLEDIQRQASLILRH